MDILSALVEPMDHIERDVMLIDSPTMRSRPVDFLFVLLDLRVEHSTQVSVIVQSVGERNISGKYEFVWCFITGIDVACGVQPLPKGRRSDDKRLQAINTMSNMDAIVSQTIQLK
jgi:hypothetical protein